MTETPSPEKLIADKLPVRRRLAYDRIALVLALTALLGVLALALVAWQQGSGTTTLRAELSRRLADAETAQRDVQSQARLGRETVEALQAKVGALEARLAETQGQQMALETMYQELSRVRDDRLLAEIEQDVAIAAQQLQLAGNVEAALIALTGVEARLARNAQPQFLSLRKLVARDIERLKALPGADVAGIVLKLDTVMNAVPNLPLAFEQRPVSRRADKRGKPVPAEPENPEAVIPANPAWSDMLRAWVAELWGEVRQLVRIERIDRPDLGLLSPRETFFLRENLRLRLLSARVGLLARDGRSFRSDLSQAEAWIKAYYDVRAPAVEDSLAAIRSLSALDVGREPVALNETLSAVRNFKLARDRGAAR